MCEITGEPGSVASNTNVAVTRPFSAHTDSGPIASGDYGLWASGDVPPPVGGHCGHLDAALFGRNGLEEAKVDPGAECVTFASKHDRAHFGPLETA